MTWMVLPFQKFVREYIPSIVLLIKLLLLSLSLYFLVFMCFFVSVLNCRHDSISNCNEHYTDRVDTL